MVMEGAWPHDDFLWKRSDSLEITRRYRAPTARDVDMIGGCLHGVLLLPGLLHACVCVVSSYHIIMSIKWKVATFEHPPVIKVSTKFRGNIRKVTY